MKQFRSTIMVFIIFIGFIGYYFYIEKKKTVKVEEKIIYIFNINKDDIKTLEFTDMSDGSGFLLKKDKYWMIEKPVQIPASKNTVEGIISALAVLTADRDITESRERLKKYGLDIPKYRIMFSLGNESHTLFIGIKNPTEEYYFVKEDARNNVYTVNVLSVEKFIGKKLTDLRDKELLRIPENEISKIVIDIKNKGEIVIEKNNVNKWIVKTAGEKDFNQDIQNIFDELGNISIEEFIENGSSNIKEYGLEKPSHSVKVYRNQGEPVNLIFGKIENNLVYTKKNKEILFFKIRRNIIDSIENLYINLNNKQDNFDTSKVFKKK